MRTSRNSVKERVECVNTSTVLVVAIVNDKNPPKRLLEITFFTCRELKAGGAKSDPCGLIILSAGKKTKFKRFQLRLFSKTLNVLIFKFANFQGFQGPVGTGQ